MNPISNVMEKLGLVFIGLMIEAGVLEVASLLTFS
jgi:hypothetical protein